MNFADALALVISGKLACRTSWPVGDFAFNVASSTFQVNRAPLNTVFTDGTSITYRAHIDRHYAIDDSVGVWNPAQDDIRASDWSEYTIPAATQIGEPVPAVPAIPVVLSAMPAVEPAVAVQVATPAPVASEPAPVAAPVASFTHPNNANVAYYLQETVPQPIFIPKFWNDTTKAFVTDITQATVYATEAAAEASASLLSFKTHIVRRSKIG